MSQKRTIDDLTPSGSDKFDKPKNTNAQGVVALAPGLYQSGNYVFKDEGDHALVYEKIPGDPQYYRLVDDNSSAGKQAYATFDKLADNIKITGGNATGGNTASGTATQAAAAFGYPANPPKPAATNKEEAFADIMADPAARRTAGLDAQGNPVKRTPPPAGGGTGGSGGGAGSGGTTPQPLTDISGVNQKAYENFTSGKGNAGTGIKVVDNGSTVTITNNGTSTTYNQNAIDLDLKKAAEASRKIVDTSKAAGSTAGASGTSSATPTPSVTHPNQDQVHKYDNLNPTEKKAADAYFAGQGLVAGTPVLNANNPVGVLAEPAKPTTLTGTATDAKRVDIVSNTGTTVMTNMEADQAAKLVATGQYKTYEQGSVKLDTPTGYVPPKVTSPSQAQLDKYNALAKDPTTKAQMDAYFAAQNLKAGPVAGGASTGTTAANLGALAATPTVKTDPSKGVKK